MMDKCLQTSGSRAPAVGNNDRTTDLYIPLRGDMQSATHFTVLLSYTLRLGMSPHVDIYCHLTVSAISSPVSDHIQILSAFIAGTELADQDCQLI